MSFISSRRAEKERKKAGGAGKERKKAGGKMAGGAGEAARREGRGRGKSASPLPPRRLARAARHFPARFFSLLSRAARFFSLLFGSPATNKTQVSKTQVTFIKLK